MLRIEEAVEIAEVIFQRPVGREEMVRLCSEHGFANRIEFRAFLIETEEFQANYPDVYYALVASNAERIGRAQTAHQVSDLQDEIQALRRLTALQEGEIVRLAGELDRFITTCRTNGQRLIDVEKSIGDLMKRI